MNQQDIIHYPILKNNFLESYHSSFLLLQSDNIKNFRLSARDQLNLSPEKVDKYLELVDNYQTILGEQIVKEYIQKNQKANSVVDTRINNIDSFITKLEKFKRNCDDYYISKTSSNSNEFENLIRSNAKLFDKF